MYPGSCCIRLVSALIPCETNLYFFLILDLMYFRAGQWAYGTNFISSIGSPNTTCSGKQSFGSRSASSTQLADMATSTSTNSSDSGKASRHLSTAAIAGIIIAIVTILLSAGLVVLFCVRRRRMVSATNRRLFPPSNDSVSPFMPSNSSNSRREMRDTRSYDGSTMPPGRSFDYSDVPRIREPVPPVRVSKPAITITPPSRSATVSDGTVGVEGVVDRGVRGVESLG